MPIRAPSSIVQPCRTALWPTLTPTRRADTRVDVHCHPVLDIRAGADVDGFRFGPQGGRVPDTGPRGHPDLADQARVGRYPGLVIHLGAPTADGEDQRAAGGLGHGQELKAFLGKGLIGGFR